MLHNYQARLRDDVWLDDISKIVPPDDAYRYLSDTVKPARIVREWDLPMGYSELVRRYISLHFQQPQMAWRDALREVECGNIVIIRRDHAIEFHKVINADGSLISTLPIILRSRLEYVMRHQLVRPTGIRSPYPAPQPQPQPVKAINSKVAGRQYQRLILPICCVWPMVKYRRGGRFTTRYRSMTVAQMPWII